VAYEGGKPSMLSNLHTLKTKQNNVVQQGFTLVEVMIAGVIMAFVMAGVSRFSISSLASGANQQERTRIENAINDNIQLIQKEDAYLTLKNLGSEAEKKTACSNPTQKLTDIITAKVPLPTAEGINQTIQRVLRPLSKNDLDILIVEYTFIAPEYLGEPDSSNYREKRTMEMNPNFSSRCYTTIS
jgi:prepilin-type N-terminal cleavage/methylation domain-containing protein